MTKFARPLPLKKPYSLDDFLEIRSLETVLSRYTVEASTYIYIGIEANNL